MPVLFDVLGMCVLGGIGYLFYRLIVGEKERDLKRREDEIKRKDQEIEKLKREINAFK